MAPADIDQDGDIDLLTASRDRVEWHENTDGDGTFGFPQLISTEVDRVESVSAADLDGDGDLDALLASLFDNKIAWYENIDGRGTYGTEKVITLEANNALFTAAADVDGDGDLDVFSSSSGKIAWYENRNGSGDFGPEQLITPDARLSQLVVVDLDGDGDDDLLSTVSRLDAADAVQWHENTDGKGTFGASQVISTDVVSPRSIAAADVDGDGDLDVMSASYGDHKVAWYQNRTGEGEFGPQQLISTKAIGARDALLADLDGDGDQDALSASFVDNKIAWYEHLDGKGTFGPQRVISIEATGVQSAAAADLDGDGDLDVISALFRDDKIAWYENTDGKATFGAQNVVADQVDGAYDVEAADLDSDGDLDLLFAAAFGGKITWLENLDGKGNFGNQQPISIETDGALSTVAADVNGDGDLDVLSASDLDHKIAWYENLDGRGNFGDQQIIAIESRGATSAFAADVDGDGDLDVLSSSILAISWYENTDGQGSFGPRQGIATRDRVPRFDSVVAADVDGDGDLDALSATSSTVYWHENTDGQGRFGAKRTVAAENSSNVRSIVAADIDGDADLDVLTASSNGVAWYEQRVLADVNDDGFFNSSDLVRVFQSGEYEDGIVYNSSFDEGDWNGDGEFNSSDLVSAFQAGHYTRAARPAEIAAAIDQLFAEVNSKSSRGAFVA